MDAERFDAWQWMMWLLFCLAGLLPCEVAVGQTAETSSLRTSAAVVGAEQDVKVAAVESSETVAEEENLSLADMAEHLPRPSTLVDTPHLNLRSTLITPCLSNDRGELHAILDDHRIAGLQVIETMHSSIGRISSRLTPMRALRSSLVI